MYASYNSNITTVEPLYNKHFGTSYSFDMILLLFRGYPLSEVK